jgi:flagellar basal body-associated protein FliL
MDSDLDTLNFFANTEIQFGGEDGDGEGGGSGFIIIVVIVVLIIILAGAYFTFIKSNTLAEKSPSSETKTNKPIEPSNKSTDT